MSETLHLGVLQWPNCDLVYTRFRLDNSADLAIAFSKLSLPLSSSVFWYMDEGVETHDSDAYGDKLRYVQAGLTAPVLREHARTTWDKAVALFVGALDNDTKIVLWWD